MELRKDFLLMFVFPITECFPIYDTVQCYTDTPSITVSKPQNDFKTFSKQMCLAEDYETREANKVN